MTSEALAPSYFALGKSLPISRFFKWFKPEYTVLAAKFLAGGVAGSIAGGFDGTGHNFYGPFSAISLPKITQPFVDYVFKDELAGSPNKLSPKTFNTLSVVATYTGSTLGSLFTILAINPNIIITTMSLRTVFNIYLGVRDLIHYRRNPPQGPTISGA